MLTVNTSGKSASEAIAVIRQSIEKNADENEIKILPDSPVLASDIKKFLEAQGFNVMPEDDDGRLLLTGIRKNVPFKNLQAETVIPKNNENNEKFEKERKNTFAISITGKNFSRENKRYGRIFLSRFIISLTKIKSNPDYIALMNEGVKLALYKTGSCDFLKELESKGTKILVSGMCADHFGITENIGVGVITGIDDIVEIISRCDKVVSV